MSGSNPMMVYEVGKLAREVGRLVKVLSQIADGGQPKMRDPNGLLPVIEAYSAGRFGKVRLKQYIDMWQQGTDFRNRMLRDWEESRAMEG